MKKIIILISVALLSLMFFNCFCTENKKSGTITILHTNDIHAGFLPRTLKAKNANQTDRKIGGMLALKSYVDKIKNEKSNILMFDAGDFMTGSPICEIEYMGVLGGGMVQLMNHIGYDGVTPGNHEFDTSIENTKKLLNLFECPVFSANLFTPEGEYFTKEPYHIYKKGNLSIGLIGVLVDDLEGYLNSPQRDQVKAKPAAALIDSLAKVIDPLTDLIVVLSHSGVGADKKIAEQTGDRVDVIIGGHSHSRLRKPIKINGKYIVQAGSNCMNLGCLDLKVAADTIQHCDYKLIGLFHDNLTINKDLKKVVDKYDGHIQKEYGKIIGELKIDWKRQSRAESNLGNYISDCIRQSCNADFAVINSGGIRKNLSAGPIKKLDIKNILPFNNYITKFEVSGNELMKIIQSNAEGAALNTHGILQISGLKYEWKKTGNQVLIKNASINGAKIVQSEKYSGATVDFVISNADNYFGFIPEKSKNLGLLLSDVVVEKIIKDKEVSAKIESRMVGK